MTDRVLSQEEVDALMKGVSSGDIETETDKDERGLKPYDLTSQDRIIRGRMPTMEVINEKFCRLFRTSFFNLIRKVVDVNVEGPKMMKYGEFLKNTPLPASFNIFQLSPLRGFSLLIFDASLVFAIVDNYFGGGGKYHTRVEGREFTTLEYRVIKRLVDMIFNDMKTSWKTVYPVNFVYSRSEVNPQFVNEIVPTEVVIVSIFNIDIENVNGKMSLCIPYSAVEPIKEKLYGSYQSETMEVDKRWIQRFEEEIRSTSTLVSCEIGKAKITISDFLNLKEGDTILLDNKLSDPLIIRVEGISKFFGILGTHNGQYATQVTGISGKEGE